MKVLLTIHQYLDPNAGAAGATLKVGHHYEQLGHDVQYYSFDDLPHQLSGVAKGVLFPEFVTARIAALAQQKAVDVINASTGDSWIWGKFLHNKRQNQPLLVTQSHGLEHLIHLSCLEEAKRGNLKLSWKYPFYNGSFRLWAVATSLRCSDLVFMLNQHEVEYAVNHLQVEPERVHFVPNGIPEAFIGLAFNPPSISDSSALRIALVGTYIPRKGVQYSVPALNQILTRRPDVKVSFFGTRCSAEKVYVDFEPTVRDRVQVIPHYSHEHLPILLQGHHILLFPSLSEGFPLAIPEAMACSLAPVATNIHGHTEIVEHENNGLLIPTHDSQAIEHNLEILINNRPYLAQLCRSAYETAQRYSWVNIAQKRLAIYEAALDKKNPNR